MTEKTYCPFCEKEKPATSFDPHPVLKGERSVRCRTCVTKLYRSIEKRLDGEGVPDLRETFGKEALDEEQKDEIRRAHAAGEATYRELASAYGVSKNTIARTVRGREKR